MELSNKTLALVVVVALAVSLSTTFSLLNRLSKLETPVDQVTGYAQSASGQVNLTVESAVSITLISSVIDFGSGFVNTSNDCNNASLATGPSGYSDSGNCWVSQSGAPNEPGAITILNDGNNNVTLNVTGPANASFFNSFANPSNRVMGISWRGENNETNSCITNLQTSFLDFAGTSKRLCDNFQYIGAANLLNFHVQVFIPDNLPSQEYRNTSIEFYAEATP